MSALLKVPLTCAVCQRGSLASVYAHEDWGAWICADCLKDPEPCPPASQSED